MHTVELYELAVGLAESMGYQVRQENLGGAGGGACEVAGRKYIFVDLTLSIYEQLRQVLDALRHDAAIHLANVPPALREYLGLLAAA
jgi:hypothetical protein